MSTQRAQTAACAAMHWPLAAQWQQLAHDPGVASTLLSTVLLETLRVTGAECGRLLLAPSRGGFLPTAYCAVAGQLIPATHAHDGIEQQALARGAGILQMSETPLSYFTTSAGGPEITTLLAAPILRGERILGLISLGASRDTACGSEHLRTLTAIATELASQLPSAYATTLLLPADQELHTFFATIPWPLLVMDSTQRLMCLNPAAERLLGRTSAQVVGLPLTEFLQGPQSQPPQLTGGNNELLRADGTRLTVQAAATRIPLDQEHLSIVIALRELTDAQVAMEERLRSAELSGIIRTIATVNHEINNPLFGMTATLHLLQDELRDGPATVLRKLERIDECCARIKQITDTLSRVVHPTRRTYAAEEGMLDLASATGDVTDAAFSSAADHPTLIGSADTALPS